MKKQTALILVLACFLSMVGCAASQPQKASNPPTTGGVTTPPTTLTPVTTTTPTTGLPVNSNNPESLSLKILVANDPLGYVDFNDREHYNAWKIFDQWCQERNLTITWEVVDKDRYQTIMTDSMVRDIEDMPDAFWCNAELLPNNHRIQLIDNERLTALEDILPHSDGTASNWFAEHPALQNATRYNGKTWWVGSYTEVVWQGEPVALGKGAAKGVTFRLDWYNQLVRRGVWDASRGYPDTVQELGDFLELCNSCDVNGNSERDEFYLNGLWDIQSTGLGTFFGVPHEAFAPNLVTGTVDTAWTQPETKALMELLIEWYNKGYFPDDMIAGIDSGASYCKNNQAAACPAYFCDFQTMYLTDVPKGADPAVLCGILPDKTVHPNAYLTDGHDAPLMDNTSLFFTANLNDPAAAAALLDIMCSEEYRRMVELGGDTYTYPSDFGYPNIAGSEMFGRYALPTLGEPYDLIGEELFCLPDISKDTSGEVHRIFVEALTQWESTYPEQINDYLAPPTAKEEMQLDEHLIIFQSLSRRIFRDLLTGAISMDDWDACIAQLKREGHMDVLQSVYQARFDRYLGNNT